MSSLKGVVLVGVALAIAGGLFVVACDDSSSAVKEPIVPKDSGTNTDGGGTLPDGAPNPDGGPTDCFLNPRTHEEIINACTDAVKITKNPTLPLLYPDGGLPPLP